MCKGRTKKCSVFDTFSTPVGFLKNMFIAEGLRISSKASEEAIHAQEEVYLQIQFIFHRYDDSNGCGSIERIV